MKKPTVLRLWAVLCTLVILSACQKETSKSPDPIVTDDYTGPKMSGSVPDDPAKVAKVPTIISEEFLTHPQKYIVTQDLLSARGKPVKTGGDVTPPTVSIASPANGSNVTGSVTVSINASDNVGISSVSLSVDGNVINTLTTSPFSFAWNTGSVTDGTHTLTAKASDGAGNSNSATITVAKNTSITTLPPTSIPASFALTMPPVQNQGGEGACAAFATTYAARSAEQFYKTNATTYSYSTNLFSPEFVYDQTKVGDCGSGTGVTTALDFLMSNGVCLWSSMPYTDLNGCSIIPSSTQISEASLYKITSYSKIISTDINAIKTMLVNKHPVIISVSVNQDFLDAKAGFIWKEYISPRSISHTIAICGYDDAKHAYKIMNSWGTSWGDSGFSWIDYDFLPQASFYYGYVITL